MTLKLQQLGVIEKGLMCLHAPSKKAVAAVLTGHWRHQERKYTCVLARQLLFDQA